MELRLLLRNGEQVGLTLVLPLLLTVTLNLPVLYSLPGRRIDFVVPSVMALAVMSAAFTGQAIGTAFERKYGVLKRLGATALPRSVLIAAKTSAILALEIVQVALVALLGLLLGWHPHGNPLVVALLVVLGTAAFGGLGLALAGTVRAEVTLAAANLIWFILLFGGGIAVPLSRYSDGVAAVLRFTPTAALSDGLHAVLDDAATFPARPVLILLGWAIIAIPAAARWFRWE
jgi:ABC-2 type transport system permease protein